MPLLPVARTPSDTVALPALTPGDLIRAERARTQRTTSRGDRVEKHLCPVPFPRTPPRPVVPDPRTAVLTSLRRAVPTPPRLSRPGTAPAVLAVLLAAAGVVLLVLALTGQIQAPAPAAAGVPRPPASPPVPASLPAPASLPVPASLPASSPIPAAPLPTRLVVPSLDVDSRLTQVGLGPDRAMEVPAPGPDHDLPAWYRYSVSPGMQGPAVIVGHVDSPTTGPSVFSDLGQLSPGDRVSVGRADGSVADFAVYAIRTTAQDAFPTADVYGATPGAELRLVTCDRSADPDVTVVFARAVRFRWS